MLTSRAICLTGFNLRKSLLLDKPKKTLVVLSRASSHGTSDFTRTSILGVLAGGAFAGLLAVVLNESSFSYKQK